MLKHPLTKKALVEAFNTALHVEPAAVTLNKVANGSEALVDGSWSFHALQKTFKALGFEKTGGKDSTAFVNKDRTVGVICQGIEADTRSNRWKKYNFEVQARTLTSAKQEIRGRILY